MRREQRAAGTVGFYRLAKGLLGITRCSRSDWGGRDPVIRPGIACSRESAMAKRGDWVLWSWAAATPAAKRSHLRCAREDNARPSPTLLRSSYGSGDPRLHAVPG